MPIPAICGWMATHGVTLMAPYTTSVHLKAHIAGAGRQTREGRLEPAATILGNAGYRGYIGLEYEEAIRCGNPALAAELQSSGTASFSRVYQAPPRHPTPTTAIPHGRSPTLIFFATVLVARSTTRHLPSGRWR